MVVAGAFVGLPVAYALARLSESLLYGVRANNVGIYLVALTCDRRDCGRSLLSPGAARYASRPHGRLAL